MQLVSSLSLLLLFCATVSAQVLTLSNFRAPEDQVAFLSRLNVPKDQKVPAFVITKVDQKWRDQSHASGDPNERRVPVLIASNPKLAAAFPHYLSNSPASLSVESAGENNNPSTIPPDYDVTEDEANDPRFKYLYSALTDQYRAKYEASIAALDANSSAAAPATTAVQTGPASEDAVTTIVYETTPPVTESPVAPLENKTVNTATAASPTDPLSAPESVKEEVLTPYQSVAPVAQQQHSGQSASHFPYPTYAPSKYHKSARHYVPTDVFTIEKAANYPPRKLHSTAIFYQKALPYLRNYKEIVLKHRPHGLTYRPNSETDDPTHVRTAYSELTPVVEQERQVPLVPLIPVLQQEEYPVQQQYAQQTLVHVQQPQTQTAHPVVSHSYAVNHAAAAPSPVAYSPQPNPQLLQEIAQHVPLVAREYLRPVSEDQVPLLQSQQQQEQQHQQSDPIIDEDKHLVGFLPVIALPKAIKLHNSIKTPANKYQPASYLSSQESVVSAKSTAGRQVSPTVAPVAGVEYSPSASVLIPSARVMQQHRLPLVRTSLRIIPNVH